MAEFRQELEGSSVVWATQRATTVEVATLAGLLDELRQIQGQGAATWPRFVAKEVQMHRTMVALSRNTVSVAVLSAIATTMERAFELLPHGHGDRIIADWGVVIDAMRRQDAAKAKAVLKEHIAFFNEIIIEQAHMAEERRSLTA